MAQLLDTIRDDLLLTKGWQQAVAFHCKEVKLPFIVAKEREDSPNIVVVPCKHNEYSAHLKFRSVLKSSLLSDLSEYERSRILLALVGQSFVIVYHWLSME